MERKKIVVVGGGAAGFFCAIQVAEKHRDWEVIILEKSSKILSKVKVSGGGRCNVTHACPDVEKLIQKFPRGQRFLKKAFYQFATKNTIDWFAANVLGSFTTLAPVPALPSIVWGLAYTLAGPTSLPPCFMLNLAMISLAFGLQL